MIGKLTWLHGREASWVVRTESGLNENVLDTNNIRLMESLNLYFNIFYYSFKTFPQF